MENVLQSCSHWAEAALPVLLDAAIKGVLLLMLALGAVGLLRKASAATRQMVWLLALLALPLLPVLSMALPQWQVLPDWARWDVAAKVSEADGADAADRGAGSDPEAVPSGVQSAAGSPTGSAPPVPVEPSAQTEVPFAPAVANVGADGESPARPSADDEDVAAPVSPTAVGDMVPAVPAAPPPPADPANADPAPTVALWILTAWMIGLVLALVPLLVARVCLWRMARAARPLDDAAWSALARRAAELLRLRRPPLLLQSTRQPMPMVWGTLRPRLLLPSAADLWRTERRWVVLLHELAHARRRDCLTKFLAHLACAIHWFNPLAWWAFKRMQSEAETACDDLVLSGMGIPPVRHTETPDALCDPPLGLQASDYAQHLLEIASGLQSSALAAYSSIAMARPSRLEHRLLAILDPHRNRRALTRLGLLLAVLLLTVVVVPLSVLRSAEEVAVDDLAAAPQEVEQAQKSGQATGDTRTVSPLDPRAEAALLREFTTFAPLGGPEDPGKDLFWKGQFDEVAQWYDGRGDPVSDYWAGQGYQLAGRWKDAAASFHRTLEGLGQYIDARVAAGGTFDRRGVLHVLRKRHAQLATVIGLIELHELDDARAAVVTLQQALRFWPEVDRPVAELAKETGEVLAGTESPYGKRPNDELRTELLAPLAGHRELARAYEALGEWDKALDCWVRIRLSSRLYCVATSHLAVDPVHVADLWRRLPADARFDLPILCALSGDDAERVIDPVTPAMRLSAWWDNSWNQYAFVAPRGMAFDTVEFRCELTEPVQQAAKRLAADLACWGGAEARGALQTVRLLNTPSNPKVAEGQKEITFRGHAPHDVGVAFVWLPKGAKPRLKATFRPWNPQRVKPPQTMIGFSRLPPGMEVRLDDKPISSDFHTVPAGPRTVSVRDRSSGASYDVRIPGKENGQYLISHSPAVPLRPICPGLPALKTIGPAGGSVVRLADGRYLLACTTGHVTPTIRFIESEDGNRWSEPRAYQHNSIFSTTRPKLIVDDDGTIWMAYFSKRLVCNFSSAEYLLWITHSRDGRQWAQPRPIRLPELGAVQGQYHTLGQLTRAPDGKYWIFHQRWAGSGDSPDDIRELFPLPLALKESSAAANAHAAFDANGTCHLVYQDWNKGSLCYTRSSDMHQWTDPVTIADAPSGRRSERPQVLVEDDRIAILYEQTGPTFVRSGRLTPEGLELGAPVQLTCGLTGINGGQLQRIGEEAFLFAGGRDYAPWLLRGPWRTLLHASGPAAEQRAPTTAPTPAPTTQPTTHPTTQPAREEAPAAVTFPDGVRVELVAVANKDARALRIKAPLDLKQANPEGRFPVFG